jgi:hypothetical protein
VGAEQPDEQSNDRQDRATPSPPEDEGVLGDFLVRLHDYQVAVAADRQAAAEDRQAAAEDRKAAARDRELAAWARQQAGFSDRNLADDLREPASGGDLGSPHALARGVELNVALRYATVREAEALEFAQQAAALAGEAAGTEQRVASTLRDLGTGTSRGNAERRLALADEAVRGADAALRRGERLRSLAELARTHLEQATVRVLLSHASTAFTELARAERAIAAALEVLAEHAGAGPAEDHRREAQRAAAAAEAATTRASELHDLEVAVHRSKPPADEPQQPADTDPGTASGGASTRH